MKCVIEKDVRKRGFTIIEILIVVVIIGILAALVTLSYTGLQKRARNASRVTSATEIIKLLNTYVAKEGKYPYDAPACIGREYNDWDGNGSLDCWLSGSSYSPQAALDNELKKVAAIPQVETSPIKGRYYAYLSGVVYYPNSTVNGRVDQLLVLVVLEGKNQSCSLKGALKDNGDGTFDTDNDATNTRPNYDGVATLCYYHIRESL